MRKMFIMIAFVIVIVFGNNVSANAASTGQCLLTTNDSGQQGYFIQNNATHCDRGTFLPYSGSYCVSSGVVYPGGVNAPNVAPSVCSMVGGVFIDNSANAASTGQ